MRLLEVTHSGGERKFIRPDALESFSRAYWQPAQVTEVDACGYDIGAGWHPAKCGQAIPCPDHDALRCECGQRAVGGCSFAGSIGVCGVPVCQRHSQCVLHRKG